MANEGNAIAALAIGAGAGYALWHFFGDKILGRGPAAAAPSSSGASVAAPPTPAVAQPTSTAPVVAAPRVAATAPAIGARCQIRVDAKAIAVNGQATNVAGAVATCSAMGATAADVVIAQDPPAGVLGDLFMALSAAHVTPYPARG